MMNLVTAPVSETFSIVGTCINCTAPASLLATMTIIAIGVALAFRSERRNGVSAQRPERNGPSEAVNRSDEVVGLVFDELLVDPAPAIVPAPYLAPQQPARDRAPRHR